MREDIIVMSTKEIERLKIIYKVMDKQLTQVKAGEFLGISDRQVRRLVGKIRDEGAKGIIHGNRGKPSPHRMPPEHENHIGLIVEKNYSDFGPTLASEKLIEREGIKVSREKLRQIMISNGLWHVRKRKKKLHQWRERKHYFGEMIQMDGSHHNWLEGRGPKIVLMGYVDDATGRVFGRFYDYEGVYPAMDSFKKYIRLYGLPMSVYLDKHSTYKTTRQPDLDELLRGESAQTQFERALKELGIKVIHANSPQAKGRIERVFGTFQDRLIKEMRLANIRTKKESNHFLERFLPTYNKRFSKEPIKKANLHRPLSKGVKLKEIFCIKAIRTITNGYTVKWRGRLFLIENPSIAIRRRKVLVMEHFDRKVTLRFNGRDLKYTEVMEQKQQKTSEIKTSAVKPVRKKGRYIPPPDHPWRRYDPTLHHNSYLERI
jgi:hypothetical protein